MSAMESNKYDDPVLNWQRLIDTQAYLQTGVRPPQNFYPLHASHIRMYLNVIETTPDCDKTVHPHLETLLEQYDFHGEFDLGIYLIAVSMMIRTKEDYDFQKEFEGAMGF